MSDESYILRLLDECREEIRVSDSKASIIFAAVGAAAAVLSSLLLDANTPLRTSGTAVILLSFVAVATLIASMLMLGLAVIPRVGRPEPGKARYFEEQAQFANHQALLAAVSAEAASSTERHAQQLLTLSRVAQRKYRHLRRAMFAVLAAVGVMVVAVAVGALN